jgi:pimeloyl-ACP methyl ester carboxylesterase
MRTVDGTTHVRGATLSWTLEGEGPLVVFCHGVTNDGRTMEDAGIFDFSPVVDAGFRLLRLDWRGHGRSGGGADPAEYVWSNLADDLLAFLDDVQPGAPVNAIGCSMGTGALVTAAVRRPDRFSRIVLTAPPTAWETRAAQADFYRASARVVEDRGLAAAVQAAQAVEASGIFAELAGPLPIRVREELFPAVMRGAADSDLPARDDIRALAVPALILSWADDPGHPVATGEQLHELLAHSRFEVADSLAGTRAWGATIARFLKGGE